MSPANRREAVSVLLTGNGDHLANAAEADALLAAPDQASRGRLWAAYEGDSIRASALLVPCAGRTAMCFVSPVRDEHRIALTASLARTACNAQATQDTRIIQALLSPNAHLERRALTDAGFVQLASLAYMSCTIDGPAGDTSIDGEGVAATTWSEGHRDLFIRAIQASYEQTLDCPALVGMRRMDDVIDSHKATGKFTPDLWTVWHRDGDPVGVMLLNPVSSTDSVELVYLGLSAASRRRGLGAKMVLYGLKQAKQRGAGEMILAVDQNNTPAVGLYKTLGFRTKTRKLAMLFALPEAAS